MQSQRVCVSETWTCSEEDTRSMKQTLHPLIQSLDPHHSLLRFRTNPLIDSSMLHPLQERPDVPRRLREGHVPVVRTPSLAFVLLLREKGCGFTVEHARAVLQKPQWVFHHNIELSTTTASGRLRSVAKQEFYQPTASSPLASLQPLWAACPVHYGNEIFRFTIFVRNFNKMVRFYETLLQHVCDRTSILCSDLKLIHTKRYFRLYRLEQNRGIEVQLALKYSEQLNPVPTDVTFLKFSISSIQELEVELGCKSEELSASLSSVCDPDGNAVLMEEDCGNTKQQSATGSMRVWSLTDDHSRSTEDSHVNLRNQLHSNVNNEGRVRSCDYRRQAVSWSDVSSGSDSGILSRGQTSCESVTTDIRSDMNDEDVEMTEDDGDFTSSFYRSDNDDEGDYCSWSDIEHNDHRFIEWMRSVRTGNTDTGQHECSGNRDTCRSTQGQRDNVKLDVATLRLHAMSDQPTLTPLSRVSSTSSMTSSNSSGTIAPLDSDRDVGYGRDSNRQLSTEQENRLNNRSSFRGLLGMRDTFERNKNHNRSLTAPSSKLKHDVTKNLSASDNVSNAGCQSSACGMRPWEIGKNESKSWLKAQLSWSQTASSDGAKCKVLGKS